MTTGGLARASSHREAPFITKNPKVDATDFYMFKSYEPGREGYVTLIANYLPLQDAYGGPNYFTMDPEALYEIHVDNNGDAKEDLTFQFRFKNELAGGEGFKLDVGGKMVAVPLVNIGPITAADTSKLNVLESYGVRVVRSQRRNSQWSDVTNAADGKAEFKKPTDYIGTKTFGPAPGYANYAAAHLYNINVPGCATDGRMFVGQRKESFAVNLGTIFDLVNAPPEVVVGGNTPAGRALVPSTIADKNITSLALELPISCLKGTGDVIGAWTTASLRQARVLNPRATYKLPALEGGAWTQVSRLSNPLVNEVVIGLRDKDRFNASEPKDDAQFADYVTNPTLAGAAGGAVRQRRRDGAQEVPARRPGGGLPHRRRGREQERLGGGDDPPQHRAAGHAQGQADQPGRRPLLRAGRAEAGQPRLRSRPASPTAAAPATTPWTSPCAWPWATCCRWRTPPPASSASPTPPCRRTRSSTPPSPTCHAHPGREVSAGKPGKGQRP